VIHLLYAGSTLILNLTIKDKNGELLPLSSVSVTIKAGSNRFEKDATVLGDGTCTLTLTPLETANSGNYHVQPFSISGDSRIPGTIRTFELQATL
jgi:hypothetical protein